MRTKGMIIGVLAATGVGLALAAGCASTPQSGASWKVTDCYGCHDTIEKLHARNKHAALGCDVCHTGIDKHLADEKARPATRFGHEVCGGCHKAQYQSFLETSYHRPARDEKSQLTNRSPNPFWDKLMMGHGFTKEHNLTRSHAWMVVDQFVVDRAFGGRFQPKNGWKYVTEKAGKTTWDYLVDTHPETNEHKPWLAQTAAAANPNCMQCKTQDNILNWPYLGDPAAAGATFTRASNVVDVARSVNYALNCFICHDPHAARPRIVRDGLIQALTRPEADTLWHKDSKRTKIEVIDMGVRGFPRKIALLEKYDSRLQCGQCHVEYNCNPGTDLKTGEPVKMTDPRTNHFPYKDVFGLYDHYVNQIAFGDFKNTLTGGLLWKAQHPEAEAYYNSRHAAAGVSCDDCHTPKRKGADGKEYTSHFAASPKLQLKETCLRCHAELTEETARYQIDSVKAHVRGKLRKAEFWLAALIDKIVEGRKAKLDEAVIKQAQDQHMRAHILWEFWTAENSDGFHNPQMAKESLAKSIDEAQKGIKIINDAINPPTAAAAPAAAPAPAK